MNKNYKKILSLKRKEEYLANLIENSLNLFDTVERAIYEFGYEHCLTFLMNSSINKNIVFEKAHVDNSLINILDSGIQDGLDNISKINYTKNVTLTNKYTRLVGENKIFYGIPGCGKSYYIEHKVLDGVDKKHNVFRTTFYLDYSNSDFIGQIYTKKLLMMKMEKLGFFMKMYQGHLRKL